MPVPVQPAPVHPVKSELTVGVAVSVTTVPSPKAFEQVVPQSIPAGLEVTEPVPVPVLDTSKVCVPRPNVAVTECAASIVTTQVPVPVQPDPDHPLNTEPAFGVAVSVTEVP